MDHGAGAPRCFEIQERERTPIASRDPQASAVERELDAAVARGASEVLVLSGEVRPDAANRDAWHALIVSVCDAALARGLLPHTNCGPVSSREMARLAECNASMGLMLEQLDADGQLSAKGRVHANAPSKLPSLRLEQLEQAGRLGVPFTTGLLLGIGETADDRRRTLEAIADSHATHGHVQEVILQPFSPGARQSQHTQQPSSSDARSFDAATELAGVVALARETLPRSVKIQIPPNLAERELLASCLAAGARDLGGVSQRDHVNPNFPFPADLERELGELVKGQGLTLRARLPVHDKYLDWMRPEPRAVYDKHWTHHAQQEQEARRSRSSNSSSDSS